MSNKEENKVDEMSSMAGGDVAGYSLPLGDKKNKKKAGTIFREEESSQKSQYIDRNEFLQELELREIVRKLIKKTQNKILKESEERTSDELKLRSIIKQLIVEAKKDVEESPHSSTAINLLEELLKQILPNLELDYKTLTTSKEQRDSFRAHIINAVSTLLDTEDVNKDSGLDPQDLVNVNTLEEEIEEEIDIKVSDIDAAADDKFIDIDKDKTIEEPVEDTFGIKGQDETGRAMAQDAFNNMEKNIVDTYGILHDEKDEKLFKDYLITNLKLYFDKYEKELGPVSEPTTPEYEAEKSEEEVDIEEPVTL